ncbi:TIGR02679 family protein [Streptomyces sp. Li-HN-5-11]|uniref:TIGR02679 family protein n=1 Tax=Streptomyces sp. Li-HN-5-11 TaxID=3075432 RepID=UPI0028ABD1E2|nr:TIGR02679 family protein [Streptomyces sp. Li-HN-5-11]WNM30889.1 TIGR02679 family protein [Streptomyces sp. Li-HN-5-11]
MDVTPSATPHDRDGGRTAAGRTTPPTATVDAVPAVPPPSEALTDVDTERLGRLLGDPGLAWFVDRVRQRLARGRPLTGSVTLSDPDEPQRRAAERLLGRAPRSSGSLSIRLVTVDEILRRSGVSPDGLAAAVVALTGPVVLHAETRNREERAWEEAYAPLGILDGELARWAERIRGDGLVRRLARTPEAAGPLVEAAVRALRALPASPPTSRATFAARNLSGAHALDEGTPLATLVLSGIRCLTGFPDGSGAQWRREAWASAGLLKDDLSSTVLTLNLRGTPALDWMADTGEPAVLTLRSLTGRAPVAPVPTTGTVHVCENPAVLSAAADTLGPQCPHMVCLQGQPSAAALTLLRDLSIRGARLVYHGDFDWGGVRIAAALARCVPWRPWRYTAADYRAAVTTVAEAPELTGPPAATPWDPALAVALAECGVRVEEETVLDDLLTDLGTGFR